MKSDTQTQEGIRLLKECLRSRDVMLFTGAGFSLGAKNGDGIDLPTGYRLKEELLSDVPGLDVGSADYGDMLNEPLSEVVSYCKDKVGATRIDDYLTERFKNCEPLAFHRVIAEFPWKEVYTTNIDDVWENAAPPGRYAVENMHRLQKRQHGASRTRYFKIHGCVRNPSEGYVFSVDEYLGEIVTRDSAGMNSYALAVQTNNFVFVGFDYDELDINTYLKQSYWRNGASPTGKFFFITPNAKAGFRNKVERMKGVLINITAAEFADVLMSVMEDKTPQIPKDIVEINGFNLVNLTISHCLNKGDDRSRLLYGDFPRWNDFCYNWDFHHPITATVMDAVKGIKDNGNNAIISLYGNMLGGKSVLLRRIGYELVGKDFQVYEISSRDFSLDHFLYKCRRSQMPRVALLVDNAPFFYTHLARLFNDFPEERQLVIVTVGRAYYHRKKQYAFRDISKYHEFYVDLFADEHRVAFAKEIEHKLRDKGLLGYLQKYSSDERVKEILRHHDICQLLYTLTDSVNFKSKFIGEYEKGKNRSDMRDVYEVLLALVLFQRLDIPSFPIEILTLWKESRSGQVSEMLGDYVRYVDRNSISLRNNLLSAYLLKETTDNEKIRVVATVLRLVAPQRPANGQNMWSMIQEKLMGFRNLIREFKISEEGVMKLYRRIKPYYDTDYNFWIQVGIADQECDDYTSAHNHLVQAEQLNPSSYLVRHALARNYLLRSLSREEQLSHEENYNEGKRRMLKLIDEKEYAQTKAYSTHSYVTYSIKYWRKYGVIPDQGEIKQICGLFKNLNDRSQGNIKTFDAQGKFFRFLEQHNLMAGMRFDWSELDKLKNILANESIDVDDFINDDYPGE